MAFWRVTVAIAAAVAVLGACSSSPSAEDRRLAQLDRTPLPQAQQPPDPCGLLTTAEVDAAFAVTARPPRPSPMTMSDSEIRACFWFTERPSGLFQLIVTIAASHRAMCIDLAIAGGLPADVAERAASQRCSTLRLPSLATSNRFVPLTGIGDQAAVQVGFTRGELFVLSGGTLLDLAEVNLQPAGDAKSILADLARKALSRRPAGTG